MQKDTNVLSTAHLSLRRTRVVLHRPTAERRAPSPLTALLGVGVSLLLVSGCGGADGGEEIRIVDVSEEALEAPWYAIGRPGDSTAQGAGIAIGDLDGDDRPDLVVSAGLAPGAEGLAIESGIHWNSIGAGEWGFEEDTQVAEMLGGSFGLGAALGDYDADGDLDVYFANWGENRLLRNDGGRSFTDVTSEAGVAGGFDDISSSAFFADLDADGLLDLYVANFVTAEMDEGGLAFRLRPSRLYLNRGDGAFEEIGAAAGAAHPGANYTAMAVDHDADGRLSLFITDDAFFDDGSRSDAFLEVSALDGSPALRYRDATEAMGLGELRSTSSMGVAASDLNGDGYDDFFITDIGEDDLYVSEPDGTYRFRSPGFGVGHAWVNEKEPYIPRVSWGAAFLDLDRDGGEELLVVAGYLAREPTDPTFSVLQEDLYLGSEGGTAFVDITDAVGRSTTPFDHASPDGRGIAVADLDGDGDDDFVISPFDGTYRAYRNETPRSRDFVRVRLVGTASSPTPVGARLIVWDELGGVRHRSLFAGGVVHCDDRRALEIGFAGRPPPSRVEILWPSGVRQRIDRLPSFEFGQLLTIEEPRWYVLSSRVVDADDTPAELTLELHSEQGVPLGAAGAGRDVRVRRSDGLPVTVEDRGDGTYGALLSHPGAPSRVRLTITIEGVERHTRPTLRFVGSRP